MHWLDRLATRSFDRLDDDRMVFRDGWGDRAAIDLYVAQATDPPEVAPIALEEVHTWTRSVRTIDLTFDSPVENLPEASQTGHLRIIEPTDHCDRIVLLMAAWNDEGYRTRSRLARSLAARGIATAMLENPYYGLRSPTPGIQPIAAVSDFAVMGRAAVLEGRGIITALAQRYETVGVGGFSMGGNIAAFVSVLVDRPIATAVMAASHAAGPPFVHGLLRRVVDWEAIGGSEGEAALDRFLHTASVTNFPPQPHSEASVILAATRDGFVPTSAVQAIHRHWPGSEMDWVNAGHATLMWRHRDRLVSAIARSFDRLDAWIAARTDAPR